jgi:hypothetical protein
MNSYISLRSEYIIETKFLIVVIYLELQRQQQQQQQQKLQVGLITFLHARHIHGVCTIITVVILKFDKVFQIQDHI